MAYTGQDLIDYEAGEEYLPQQYYQQKFQRNITGPEIMGQGSGITSASAARPYVWPPVGQTERDKGGGYGRWGNLDEDSMKVFDKQVWGVSKPGGQLGWVNQPVTGYKNVNSGHYQTLEGKNINHLGMEVPSVIGMIGNAITGQKFGEHQVGDTAGTFTKDKELSEEEQAIHDAAIHRSRINKIKAMQEAGLYEDIRPHAGGEDISTVDTSTSGDGKGGGVTLGSSTPAEGETWHPGVGNQGGQTTQAAADKAGGSWDDSPFYAGGRVGYNRGRVVNPGGYAGDEDAGILEWIKSKMGSESETNPTVFGTQDSLLNRGSIAQLQDAIESYEALMHMGDLDEDQLADYELKLSQLSALTEGATQKAHGGRVPFFYGGLATIL